MEEAVDVLVIGGGNAALCAALAAREAGEPGAGAACATLRSPLASLRHTSYGGWVFNCPVPDDPPEGMEARIAENMRVMTDHMDQLRARWDAVYQPRVVELTDEELARQGYQPR